MKKNRYTSLIKHACRLLMLPLLLTACNMYEYPEETENGEKGIDPTEVTVTAELNMVMKLTEAESPVAPLDGNTYQHRFIIAAYLNREEVARQVVYEEITRRTQLNIPVTMKLHARNYQLLVWSDYVKVGSEADLHYNTGNLVPLISAEPYTANTEYKDAFTACTPLDLTAYRDAWNAKVPVKVELKRPVARYQLIANDVESFLSKIANGKIKGTRFTARISYNNYQPVGYNVLDDVPKHSLMYLQYSSSFTAPAASTKELTLGKDYVFVTNGKEDQVSIMVEILNESNEVIARTSFYLPCQRNKNTTVRMPFLTANPEGGIGIDPDYEGEINIDLGPL